MKKLLIFLLCWLASGTFAGANDSLPQLLEQLQREIANKPIYDAQKERLIAETKRQLNIRHLLPVQEYGIYKELTAQYYKYNIDSAVCYAQKALQIAQTQNSGVLETRLLLSQLYSTAGMYIEAYNTLQNIEIQSVTKEHLPLYYESWGLFYDHYSLSTNKGLYTIEENYRDLLLSVMDTASMLYKINFAKNVLYKGYYDDAQARLLPIFESLRPQDSEYALVAYLMSLVCEGKNEKDAKKCYLILSAIADIKNSIKDNASMRRLATIYYEEGNTRLAYPFIHSATEDLAFCNVHFRAIELLLDYSIINAAYRDMEAKQKSTLWFYLILIGLLLVSLVVAILLLYKQMRKRSKVRKKLFVANQTLREMNQSSIHANKELHKVNAQLSESNRVKEEYIAHFFDLCSSYITKLEDYRKSLNKLAMNNKREELMDALKSTTLMDDERKKLYQTFDTVFLHLYPTFVKEFNALLVAKEQIVLKSDELLNAELRIFALIRLGITDSVKIAGFLHYSLSTIYNYRTQVRNKAIGSRSDFEMMVMKIGIQQK
ncbi:hypothetical protein FACS1894156_5960 [Bacteroidia bacterium]|nr:hypothetical protein FACS1894156_5960 [Bacteroidia bacterium]